MWKKRFSRIFKLVMQFLGVPAKAEMSSFRGTCQISACLRVSVFETSRVCNTGTTDFLADVDHRLVGFPLFGSSGVRDGHCVEHDASVRELAEHARTTDVGVGRVCTKENGVVVVVVETFGGVPERDALP